MRREEGFKGGGEDRWWSMDRWWSRTVVGVKLEFNKILTNMLKIFLYYVF